MLSRAVVRLGLVAICTVVLATPPLQAQDAPSDTLCGLNCPHTIEHLGSAYPNVQIFLDIDTIEQSEMSIAISPVDPLQILVGANTTLGPHNETWVPKSGSYYSFNSGAIWDGDDWEPDVFSFGGDPVVAFDSLGLAYYCHIFMYDTFARQWQVSLRRSP